jgi:hypothetical protein
MVIPEKLKISNLLLSINNVNNYFIISKGGRHFQFLNCFLWEGWQRIGLDGFPDQENLLLDKKGVDNLR